MTGDVRVLQVDDDPDFADLTATFLERESDRLTVETALDADAGLSRLDEDDFDCVVSDYDMPGRNGIEFLEAVRETYPDLPVILFTGQGSEEIASEAIAAGVTDYLQKGTDTAQYELLANRVLNAVEAYRSRQELTERTRRLETLIGNLPGIVYRCRNERGWPMETVEGNAEELTGYRADELELGEVVWGEDVVHPDDRERMWEAVQTALDAGDAFEVTYRVVTRDGETKWLWERGSGVYDDGELEALEGFITDVTDQREKRTRLQQYRHIVDDMDQSACIYDEDGRFVTVNRRLAEWYGTTPSALEGERSGLVERIREEADSDPFAELVRGERESLDGELEGEFPGHGHARVAYRLSRLTVDGEFRGVVAVARDVTDRRWREDAIAELHRVTRDLFRADSGEEVAERVADAVSDILGYPGNVVRLLSDDGRRLEAVAVTANAESMLGDRPVYRVGEGTAGRAFERGERLVYDDVRTFDDDRNRGEARAGMYLPIGDHGTLSVNDTTPGAFDEVDVQLAEILTANAEAALDRLDRLAELRRQNERLEEFTGVVSHDIRNPLNVAEGRLAMARADCDSSHLDDVDAALDRIQALVDDLLAYARKGKEVHEPERIDLADLSRGCWQTVETADAILSVETDRTIRGDPGRVRELVENLFRNAVEHTDGPVTITVGDLEEGFYVEDDGPGIEESKRERIFESGYSTDESGTGFGLTIVEQIVEAHGWNVRATESETGGARFEITGA